MILKFVGIHNASSIHTKLSCIIIDDILSLDAGSLASGLTFDEQQKIRSILISHEHLDHIADIPLFALNNQDRTTKIFGTKYTLDILASHLMDGIIYPRLFENLPFAGRQVLELCRMEPLQMQQIETYEIKAVSINHSIDSVGFEVLEKNGKGLFYTGDAGEGLSAVWPSVNPNILIVDLTFPDKLENLAFNSKHLTPRMLGKELFNFKKLKGYLPTVIPIHLSPKYEVEIREELDVIARELDFTVITAVEGTRLTV
jgi:ribonuclease BN (tRNA processing enzyme)